MNIYAALALSGFTRRSQGSISSGWRWQLRVDKHAQSAKVPRWNFWRHECMTGYRRLRSTSDSAKTVNPHLITTLQVACEALPVCESDRARGMEKFHAGTFGCFVGVHLIHRASL
jgi:hypothetical protein